ncbi:hypothetical protein [Streptomyces sp. CS62]|uniref:hypothetical protein n=1 Tax=Streptomyces sp. CS62 TaxID=3119268 RepID=UPI002F922433
MRRTRYSAPEESRASQTRSAVVEVVSAATGATRYEIPRARGAEKYAAGVSGCTWLT